MVFMYKFNCIKYFLKLYKFTASTHFSDIIELLSQCALLLRYLGLRSSLPLTYRTRLLVPSLIPFSKYLSSIEETSLLPAPADKKGVINPFHVLQQGSHCTGKWLKIILFWIEQCWKFERIKLLTWHDIDMVVNESIKLKNRPSLQEFMQNLQITSDSKKKKKEYRLNIGVTDSREEKTVFFLPIPC
ncbi:hypothetical protein BDF21DRAFT_487140 [Thamnidium elegans]|nr:hypothetical protein BDF21DRAFT_487140 [Thamnidium elegans]